MNIQGLYSAGEAALAAKTAASKTTGAASADKVSAQQAGEAQDTQKPKNVDTVEISREGREAEAKKLTSQQLMELQDQQMASFQNMIASILNKQAGEVTITKDLFSQLTVSPETSANAAQAISEDGEWGVDAVAGRIMDMVVSMSGGDTSKLETYRDAVYKGFSQAEKQWGGTLPDISYKTRAELDKRFDYLGQNGSMDGYVMGKTSPEE